MADAKPMHKGGLACFPSRQRESKSEGSKLMASAFAARHSATSCSFSGPRVVCECKERLLVCESSSAKKSAGDCSRTPHCPLAVDRGGRGGCPMQSQRFETCVILADRLDFSSSPGLFEPRLVWAPGVKVRAPGLARSGGAAPFDRDPTCRKCASSPAVEASAPPASAWRVPTSLACLLSRMLAINNPRIPTGKPHHGTNNHFRHDHPDLAFFAP
jgi:hypothetical protein